MLSFTLNDKPIELERFEPHNTVLDFLRLERGLTGTKEGCGSGDCGACTVVLVEANQYRPINACICLLGSLQGKQLVTVEHLAKGNQLHSCQRAMVEQHGSQCGFCTPGFVMSLYALGNNNPAADQQQIEQALAGNLCRCTGYQSILKAAKQHLANAESVKPVVQSWPHCDLQRDHSFFWPTSSDQLAELLLQYPSATILAGGTDLGVEITQLDKRFERFINLAHIAELQSVEQHPEHWLVGAGVSIETLKQQLSAELPALETLLERFASLQVRGQATLAGNIANASPIGDLPPVLLALGASLILRKGAKRRELAIEEFFLDYRKTALQASEFIEKIRIPKHPGEQLFISKVSKRREDDISAVCLACLLKLDAGGQITQIRIGLGGMAATPVRAYATEHALTGQALNRQSLTLAQQTIVAQLTPLSDVRASAEYRQLVVKNLLERIWFERQANLEVADDN